MKRIFLGVMVCLFTLLTTTHSQEHKAVFSDFIYEGHDVYYEHHPLKQIDQAYNPILPGWYSDPSLCADGKGNYYIVTSTFGYYPGVPLFHSNDLINWRQTGSILTRPKQHPLDGQSMGKEGIYAASMFYNKFNQTYYLITTNMGRMTLHRKPGTFIVKTKDPEGAWSDPVYLQNMGGIDPSMFFDEDGRAYVLYCQMHNRDYPGHNSIIMQEYDVENDSVITSTARVIADRGAFPKQQPMCLEGPHLYKINGKYYLLCAEGGTELNHSEVVFRSDSLWGDYRAWEKNPILTQRTLPERKDGVYCAGHADLFQDIHGKWWSVFLASRRIDGKLENLGRETFLMPVRWTDDGWPVITEDDEQVPLIVTIPGTKRGTAPTFGNFIVKDNFDQLALPAYWQTVRNAATDQYSLSEQPGNLVLKCSTTTASDKNSSPAFIGRRLQHHQFTATTHISFSPTENERAGILLLKSEDYQYFLSLGHQKNENVLEVLKISEGGLTRQMATQSINGITSLHLRVSSPTGYTFTFSYSEDGKKWITLLDGVDAGYLATKVEGTASSFTGTLVGLYATKGL